MIDCTRPITTIKPFRGCVLVELIKPPTSINGVFLPESVQARAGCGTVVEEMAKHPAQEAIVRRLGEPDPKRPYEIEPGNRVLVNYYKGTDIRSHPRRFKMLKAKDVLAVFV